MDTVEAVELGIALAVPVIIVLAAVGWFRRRRRDEIFSGVTPGELPALGQQVTRGRLPRGRDEYAGTVAVRFTPPDGLTPGLVGTVVDGRADVVDVSATLVDLAVRGHLRLEAIRADPDAPPPPQRGPKKPKVSDHDWRLIRLPGPTDALLPVERALLEAVFANGAETTIGELQRRGFDLTMREAQIGLYREVVDRGWYTRHPRDRNRKLAWLGIPLALVGLFAIVGVYGSNADWSTTPLPDRVAMSAGVGMVIAAVILWVGGRGRTPRTAEGTAARIQALGFREYLTKAEASQIRFEEAADLFSRYLPYAMVFGVADRWATTFADVARRAELQGVGHAFFDLTWLDAVFIGGELVEVGAGLIGGVADLTAVADLGGLGVLGETLGQVAGGVGDFASSTSGLLDFGDGCGGCDGCDLG